MPPLLALLTMITTVHPANLVGTWDGKSGTLTIDARTLRHSATAYPGTWSTDGKELTVEWDPGVRAILLSPLTCVYMLTGNTLTLRRYCGGMEGTYTRR
jgi:hypothetical protein